MIVNCNVMFPRLADIREDMDMSQEELARNLKVTQATYSRWETGKEIIPLTKLNDYCNYTKHSMDYVCGLIKIERYPIKICPRLNPKTIGNNLKKFRITNELFQIQLADFLNTTQSTISSYESGKTLILTAFLYQITKEYKLSMDTLCERN